VTWPTLGFEGPRYPPRGVLDTGIRRVFWVDLSVRKSREVGRLQGCGMVVVNPPYGFAEEAASILDWLRRVLAPAGGGAAPCRVLVGE